MQFKQHETTADLSNEQQVANEIQRAWKCHANKLPKHYRADFVLTRGGKVFAFAEVKCRTIPHNRYRHVILGLAKVAHMRMLADIARVPIYFVVRFTDGIFYADLSRGSNYNVGYGGQLTKMRDERDMEPICQIPISTLVPLQ